MKFFLYPYYPTSLVEYRRRRWSWNRAFSFSSNIGNEGKNNNSTMSLHFLCTFMYILFILHIFFSLFYNLSIIAVITISITRWFLVLWKWWYLLHFFICKHIQLHNIKLQRTRSISLVFFSSFFLACAVFRLHHIIRTSSYYSLKIGERLAKYVCDVHIFYTYIPTNIGTNFFFVDFTSIAHLKRIDT